MRSFLEHDCNLGRSGAAIALAACADMKGAFPAHRQFAEWVFSRDKLSVRERDFQKKNKLNWR